ncbi:hypothetical protein [Kutzneria albida]|uniref:Uncharacterized protein n=1 Tax=Kutzneria albida DSM 43870 TaxID=1449976 RepID=W5WJZ4_9PSEU|nr:hypothetical protein [Kutzneria albida]AHI01066.1 hypothetical protein KALB_7708 [Kutzneria albida DSM 43870]
MTKKRWAAAGSALLVTGLCAVVVLLYQRQAQASALDTARDSAAEAAKTRLPQLLSYDYHTVDHDLETARAATTGSFSAEFAALASKVVAPAAKDQQIVTKTTVSDSSVISAQPDRVVLLVFLDQVTQSKSEQASRVDGARVRVTLQRADDQWLVAELTPV